MQVIQTRSLSKKAKIVDKTPFDSYEKNLMIEIIKKELNKFYELTRINQSAIQN
jgi:hypothetical protein